MTITKIKAVSRDENGQYDFEALEALDIQKLDEDLLSLSGQEAQLPRYDFMLGMRKKKPRRCV